jgi:hypothetical protein
VDVFTFRDRLLGRFIAPAGKATLATMVDSLQEYQTLKSLITQHPIPEFETEATIVKEMCVFA